MVPRHPEVSVRESTSTNLACEPPLSVVRVSFSLDKQLQDCLGVQRCYKKRKGALASDSSKSKLALRDLAVGVWL